LTGRNRYTVSPLALVNLIAITPFFLPLVILTEFRQLRLLRLLRIFRPLQLGRYSNAFETFADVLKSKKEELIISLMTVIILILVSSSLYGSNTRPSIPDAMWWAVVTLVSVG
jgi:voltage-gated potassium channel